MKGGGGVSAGIGERGGGSEIKAQILPAFLKKMLLQEVMG